MVPCLASAAKLLLAIQAAQATVAGTVRDADTGRPIEQASVALTDLDRAVSTGADGRYAFADVPPGPHHVTVRFIGYSQRTLHALVPREGRLDINVALEPAPARLPTIEVRPGIAVRGAEDRDTTVSADRSVSMAAAWNDPLLSEPDGFVALGGGDVALDPESPGGVHIRGGASDQTGYLLDGIPVFSPYHAAGVFSAWNPDALSVLHLSSSGPSPDQPDALAGTISAQTREPGASLRTQGSFSTTQARVTVDGPVGLVGSRFLLSVRSGAPYWLSKHEASYLESEVGDWLATVEAPLLGGQVRALGYDNDNEINAAAVAGVDTVPEAGTNRFEWQSRSVGAEWRRSFPRLAVRLLGWHATADAGSTWAGQAGGTLLAAERGDYGLVASAERRTDHGLTLAGLRLVLSRSGYQVRADSDSSAGWEIRARTPVATLFAQHTRALARRIELRIGATLAAADDGRYLGPRVQLGLRPSDRVTLLAGSVRTHQFSQSLRNPESVVGHIFPADLFIGAGAPGVPVARSDQHALSVEYRPAAGVRLALQGYRRNFDGVLLVAPGESGPFASGGFTVGSGRSLGLSLEAAMSTARWALVSSYGWQHLRLDPGASRYVPAYGASHMAQGGVTFFPTATTSIRLGAVGALGRRATGVAGGFEWESCNLLDQGCEFGGSPTTAGELGGVHLPAYARVDLGVRKHWHFTLGGRDAMVAVFGTVTNVLNRKNVLTVASTPDGRPVPIELRPLAPLVVGLDWRF